MVYAPKWPKGLMYTGIDSFPRKQEMLTQYWSDFGQPSTTLSIKSILEWLEYPLFFTFEILSLHTVYVY